MLKRPLVPQSTPSIAPLLFATVAMWRCIWQKTRKDPYQNQLCLELASAQELLQELDFPCCQVIAAEDPMNEFTRFYVSRLSQERKPTVQRYSAQNLNRNETNDLRVASVLLWRKSEMRSRDLETQDTR